MIKELTTSELEKFPNFDKEKYIALHVPLENIPHGPLLKRKKGSSGSDISFHNNSELEQYVLTIDDSGSLVWARVSGWSRHENVLLEIVELENGKQLFTDDDPRSVVGVDPNSTGLGLQRFTPSEALARRVMVPCSPEQGLSYVKPFTPNEDQCFNRFYDAYKAQEKLKLSGTGPTRIDARSGMFFLRDCVHDTTTQRVDGSACGWTRVTGVVRTNETVTGYDLTVPGYETFMNSDGVVLSNTLGIFVPSLPEAVEDVKNRLMPSKQIFSIRDPDKVMNAPQQDLILGLWNAANSPSKKTHVFETEREAILAIQQGRVSLSDEVKINQKKAASLVESHTEEIFNKQALQTKTARYGAGVLFRNPDGTYLLEENQPEKGPPDEYVGKLRPAGGGKSKSDKNLRETIIREIGEEFGLSEDFVKDRIKLIGYINHGKFEDCAMFEMVDHGLKPGVYQATNSPTEKIKLVKSTLEDPLYVGAHPKKLRKYSLRGYRGMGRNKNKITPWVGVDLDGTLAEIGDKEFNIMHIGKPVPKMVAKVKHLMKNNTVKIFTARAQNPKSIPAIEDWCRRYLGEVLEVTNIKDPGMQYLMDDRAVSIEKNMGTVKKATINDDKTLNKVATVGDWGHDLQVPSTPTEPASLNTEPKVVTQAPSKYGFDAATKRLLEREGGNTLVTDSGGLTRFGISQNAHPDTNITDITEQQSIDIYRTQYWPSDLDDFPRVQEKLYDLRVNAGPRSNRWLQSSINKLGGDIKVDGHLGPLTLKAMGTVDQGQLFKALQERQIEYYNHLIKVNPAKYKQYYNEWMHRSKFDPLDYYE